MKEKKPRHEQWRDLVIVLNLVLFLLLAVHLQQFLKEIAPFEICDFRVFLTIPEYCWKLMEE